MAERFSSMAFLLLTVPLFAGDGRTHIEAAAKAEERGQYDRAAEHYLKGYLAGERTAEVRQRMHDCQRRVRQHKRHRDAAHLSYAKALPPAEALNLYAEILEKLAAHHADRVTAEELWLSALREIDRALEAKPFRENLGAANHGRAIEQFRQSLKDSWPQRVVVSPREARLALQDLLVAFRNEAPVDNISLVVLEAIHGACAGSDDATAFLPPTHAPATEPESTITRAEIVDSMHGLGLIAISRFKESTPQDFDRAVAQLKMQGLQALIVDLRDNSGGSFPAALAVCERLIPAGPLVSTQARIGEFDNRHFSSSSGPAALTLPLVVLVNARTMSAAEVVAGAVKENRRGVLVGSVTFGKGSIQAPLPLESADAIDYSRKPRSGLLVVTVARTVTAAGLPIHLQGITPDALEENADRQLALAIRRANELLAGMPDTMPQ